MPRGTEVVIAGAGPAGCVAALLLARLGARVALVADTGTAGRPLVGEVLPAAARSALARLGLGGVLQDPAHRPTAGIVSAWGHGEPTMIPGDESPLGPGLQLDRQAFDAALREEARAAGVREVRMPRTAWPALAATAGTPGGPAAVVDASGRAASVARVAGWTLDRADRLVAIVGIVEPRQDADRRGGSSDQWLRVAATPDGWWSTMMLPSGRRIAAFHTDAGSPAARATAQTDRWWSALLDAPSPAAVVTREPWGLPTMLHVVAADSRRRCPPEPGAITRIVPVGDAEMAFDPLSSFGILGAISSAEEALPVVAALMEGDEVARAAIVRREAAREHRWRRYRERLAAAYHEETRWPDAPFWVTRHAPHVAAGAAMPGTWAAP